MHLPAAKDFFRHVSAANTEEAKKLQFVNYLNQVFASSDAAKRLIQEFAGGAEKKVMRIFRGDGTTKTGFADTQYRNVIIEFEPDIKAPAKLRHAEYQLREYFAGNYNSHPTEDFRLLATDGIRWKVYGALPASYLGKKNLTADDIKLQETESFILSLETAGQLFSFIDRQLFRLEKQVPTLENILLDFGTMSALYMQAFGALKGLYEEVRKEPELATAYQEWQKFMSLAYGSFKASGDVFVVHTYLSVFAKLIAYELLTLDPNIDEERMLGVLDGSLFANGFQINNFVEHDFYQWVAVDKYFRRLLPAFGQMADQLTDYDFSRTEADILKGVYQHLMDAATRQSLGEYYTPDWLCQQVAETFTFQREARILDPSCGSGSFLLAAVRRLIDLHPDITVEELCQQVAGIDIHPLSVQIAKTTLLLALGKDRVSMASRPLNLRVYLSNTLQMPVQKGSVTLYQENFVLRINKKAVFLPNQILDYPDFFDKAVSTAEYFANENVGKPPVPEATLADALAARYPNVPSSLHGKFYDVYKELKRAKEQGKDSIWQFILQNTYKPAFLRQQFDYVLGNPPWFTYNSVANADYQKVLLRLAKDYGLEPKRKALMPQLEIAAIFLSHVSSYLLKPGGKMALVLPRSFLSADQHDPTRTGGAKGFRLTAIWDLKQVQPLFPVPSCVLFGETKIVQRAIPTEGLPGLNWKGRPPGPNATWLQAQPKLVATNVTWQLARTSNGSALTTGATSAASEEPYYKSLFLNGATMIPRKFFFVSLEGQKPPNWHNREIPVRSDEANDSDAKEPWKGVKLRGRINTDFLFRTALARHLVPFGMIAPPLVVLPLRLSPGPPKTSGPPTVKVDLYNPIQLRNLGYLETATWFSEVERTWEKLRTEKNQKITAIDYMNWQGKLVNQQFDSPYIVMYSASAKDANALVFERGTLDLEFIVDKAAYAFYSQDAEEAHFLAAFLNSDYANESMKPFQSSGLFGARDVSRKILDVHIPPYDAANPLHNKLAELGRECADVVKTHIATHQLDTTEYKVGKVRLHLRKVLLRRQLELIDTVLQQIIEQVATEGSIVDVDAVAIAAPISSLEEE